MYRYDASISKVCIEHKLAFISRCIVCNIFALVFCSTVIPFRIWYSDSGTSLCHTKLHSTIFFLFYFFQIRSYCIKQGRIVYHRIGSCFICILTVSVPLVMHIASGSALEMFILFCTWTVICFAGHVLVFVLCEHFCLVSMCFHVYCLDSAHVTSLLVQLPHLLSLITLLICSLFILLVFVVLCQFVVICSLIVS